MAQVLAVVAVWAGLLGYVIPAAFSTAPAVTATVASAASHTHVRPRHALGSTVRAAGGHQARGGLQARSGPRPTPDRPARQPDLAKVRVIQASQRPRRVSVTLGRQTLSREQAFAGVTPYRSVRPGTWTVRAVAASEQATTRVTLAPGTATTLVVLGGRGHLVVSAQADRTDVTKATASAVSSPVVSTPRPSRSPIPWLVLVLVGTGLLLGVAGAARLRQIRWARRVAARIR
jgi:hypothetical protein